MTVLLDAALGASLVVLAGLLATWSLRRRSAAWRHRVLALSLLTAPAVLPLGLVLPAWPMRWPGAGAPTSEAPGLAGESVGLATARVAAVAAAGRAGRADRMAPNPERVWRSLGAVWIGGIAVGVGLLFAALERLARVMSQAQRVCDDRWVRAVAQASAAHGLSRPVGVFRTASPDLLATWGLIRARVLVPRGADDWSDDRIAAVVCHELAHVVRHDWILQMYAECLRVALWWNPLLWIACHRLREESERAADDLVIDAGVSAHAYAGHLLEIARTCRRTAHPWVAAMPMARPSTLQRRIVAMLDINVDRTRPSRRGVLAATMCLLAVLVPAAALRGAQGSQPLAGVVYDTSGAVMPDVELTLSGGAAPMQAVTDAAGRFEFAGVDAGTYVLEAKLPGFRPLRQELALRQAADWDRAITLQVGTVQETIVVRERRGTAAAAAAPATGPAPVRVGGNIRPPRKLVDVKPIYPPGMREAGREGIVPLEALIGVDGRVSSVRVVSAQVHPDLAIAAAEAVRQWQFEPTLLNGSPVDVVMTVSVRFALE